MGAEDFGFIAEEIPCTYFMIGTGSGENPPTNFGLHHPKFALDESQMPLGAEMHLNWAIRALKYLGEDSSCEASVDTSQSLT
jgi:IAA-amino acid hydrolase